MTSTTPRPRRRVGLIVAGALLALPAVGLGAAGGAALWADGQADDQGYLTSNDHRLSTTTAAMVSENLDFDLDGVPVDDGRFASVRVSVDPKTDEPVFVGIARTAAAQAYVAGVDHTVVTDAIDDPSYRDVPGDRDVMPPGNSSIWAASSSGSGAQTMTWDVQDGDWSVVVMNADGSPNVDVALDAGAELPWLDDAGLIAIGGGLLLAAPAAVLIALGLRRRPGGPPADAASPAPAPTPAAV